LWNSLGWFDRIRAGFGLIFAERKRKGKGMRRNVIRIAGQPKYMGPAPPAGHPYHHYIFQLYALNAMPDLPATATRADIEKAIEGKIVVRGAFTGKVKGS